MLTSLRLSVSQFRLYPIEIDDFLDLMQYSGRASIPLTGDLLSNSKNTLYC